MHAWYKYFNDILYLIHCLQKEYKNTEALQVTQYTLAYPDWTMETIDV